MDAQWADLAARSGAVTRGGDGLLPEGSRFGGYLVGPCIGQGGMARIYRAEHEGLQRQVALKVLLGGLGTDRDGHERFIREARIAAAIKHPNVVNIFDVGVNGNIPYLVMELLDGVDLESFVQSQGPIEEATIMDVIMPIVAGLAAVHDAGIVHRDLKPGNIFLARGRGEELEPKLLDFGISKSISPGAMKVTSTRGLMMGTPFYMSPEAARGEEMTPLSDQYSLGVVLYECATGVNPFTPSDTFAEVVRRVATGDYEPVSSRNPRLSRRMASIIERAMQLEPTRRFPDMRAMGRELLVLAGQRTRITWGLSFGELAGAPRAALALASDTPPGPKPRATRFRRAVYPVAAALMAILAWGGLQALRESEPVRVQRAPLDPQGSLAALRPKPVDPRVQPLPNTSARVPAPAAEFMIEPEPAVMAPRQALRGEGRRRSARERSRPGRVRWPGAAKPPATHAVEAEWFVSAQPDVPAERGANLGTNNAPIFD